MNECVSSGKSREAIEADPANPFSYFKLAARLRARSNRAGAREMLKSARLRLRPIDADTAVDASLRLLQIQEMNDAVLPELPSKAATPADLFDFLVADPAFSPFGQHLHQGWPNLAP